MTKLLNNVLHKKLPFLNMEEELKETNNDRNFLGCKGMTWEEEERRKNGGLTNESNFSSYLKPGLHWVSALNVGHFMMGCSAK